VTRGAREVVGPGEDTVERALDRCAGLTATPEDEFFHHVIGDRHLATAIDGLSPSFREVVILADLEEPSYREIAQMRELPIGTVMSRLARAHRLLRKALRGRRGVRGALTAPPADAEEITQDVRMIGPWRSPPKSADEVPAAFPAAEEQIPEHEHTQ
jgi:RNA polymerase sigma-70 factor (ECF subfamily)